MTFHESYSFDSSIHPDVLMSGILNKLDTFVFILDVQKLKILWANRYLINKIGYSFTVLQNMSSDELLELIHPDFRELLVEKVKNTDEMNTDNPYGLFKIKIKNNQWIWVLATSISFEKDKRGKVCSVLTFATQVNIDELNNQMRSINHIDKSSSKSPLIKLLSCREKMVIELIANGNTDKKISEFLGISIHTAKTHRKRIIHKMGLKNSGALIKYAVENGLD